MTERYNFGKAFGPAASLAGYVILAAGIIQLYFTLSGLVLVAIGALLGFTDSSTIIDYQNRKARFSNNIFGFIKIGKWVIINPEMRLGMKVNNIVNRTYSRSNLYIDVADKKITFYLLTSKNNAIIPLKNSGGNSEKELEELSQRLGNLSISKVVQVHL